MFVHVYDWLALDWNWKLQKIIWKDKKGKEAERNEAARKNVT